MNYREYRYPCGREVTVTLPDRKVRGTIINISTYGARLGGVQSLKVGYRIRIDPGPGCPIREGEVRWVRNGLAGLRFDTALDERIISAIRLSNGHRTPPHAAKGSWNLRLREMR